METRVAEQSSGPSGSASRPPVPLFKRSSSHFQVADRERGEDYFHGGRVEVRVDGSRVLAKVRGGAEVPYSVGLDWSRVPEHRALHAFCDCPRFSGRKPCKHVWAALLAVAEVAPDQQPQGTDRLSLRKDGASKWPELNVVRRSGEGSSVERPSGGNGDLGQRPSRGRGRRGARGRGKRSMPKEPDWRAQLASIQQALVVGDEDDKPQRSLVLLINTSASRGGSGLVLDVFAPRKGPKDEEIRLQRAGAEIEEIEEILGQAGEGVHRFAIVSALPPEPPRRKGRQNRGRRPPQAAGTLVRRFRLPAKLYDRVLPHLCSSESLGWWDGRSRNKLHLLWWDSGAPWRLSLRLDASGQTTRLSGGLERDGEKAALSDPLLILPFKGDEDHTSGSGLVLFDETIARLESSGAHDDRWLELLREEKEIVIPRDELDEALSTLFEIPGLPAIEASEELQLEEASAEFEPRLMLEPDPAAVGPDPPLLATLSFCYGSLEASAEDPRPSIIDWPSRTFLRRDMEAEHEALVHLLETEVQPVASGHGHGLELSPDKVASVAESLLAEGWIIEVRGTSLRSASPPALKVESGVDWFELSGSADFAGDKVELMEIMEAVRRGDRFVELSDGSKGLLPASWMETYGSLDQLAHDSSDDGLRFFSSQALLVDARLALMPPIDVDKTFAELRDRLKSFESIKPKKEPRGFRGELREYQREGLGWLGFLRDFGLGGILADDMGLGKTVQVLALLRANRTKAKSTGLPSLVVAPKSLLYNWVDEVGRFTPTLSVMEYSGPNREAMREKFSDFDLIVTTYGTLRRDIDFLSTVEFDTVILDEAQAIKNRDSQGAKASRLLVGRNRLALTGTPIENHLGELGSIFEFLNPGLLGRMPRLDVLSSGRESSREELKRVVEGIRPFILRRTKSQVLKDLPPKTEQVLYCTMGPEQREIYDKLRAGYQASLLDEMGDKKVSGKAIQVLEALLRLRQVACHPGLVNPEWEDAGSAKLEALFEQVAEVLEEGHKAIVFSQFTSLLAYVKTHFDEQGVNYAYLDGQTRNRGDVVERFQTQDECNLFLISLKAGGLGLNLTAAGYVFLLDPWWNPAVEAQAIDRAHRIGQTQPVFSYRLIARDTVEEKILVLQKAKKKLAGAVLEGDGIGLRDLKADDLRVLFS